MVRSSFSRSLVLLLPLLIMGSTHSFAQNKKKDTPPKKTETKPPKSKTATPPAQTGTTPATPAGSPPPKDATTTGQPATNPPLAEPAKSIVSSGPSAQPGTPSAPAAAPGTSRAASVPAGQPATANTTGAQPSKSIASVSSTPSPKEHALQLTIPQFDNELTAMLGEKMGLGSPLVLNQKSAYQELSPSASDMTDFHPVHLRAVTVQDMQKPLPPGDYSADVLAFCTQASIHQPGQGLPYKLASVEGKQASAISTLIVRGVIHKVSPATINAEAWRIESGLPLSKWPPEDRALMHRLMPEYTARLEVDPFHQKPGVLGNLSPKLDEQRKILSDKTLAAERLPDRLYEPAGDGFGRKLPAEEGTATSPWMKLKRLPGVYARFKVVGGNLQSNNKFEFRITSAALRPKKAAKATSLVSYVTCGSAQNGAEVSEGPSLSEVMGMGNPVGQGAMLNIGYPIGRGAQALIPVLPAQPDTVTNPMPDPPSGSIALTKATTPDALNVTVDYTVAKEGLDQPIHFEVYRCDQPTKEASSNPELIGTQDITDDPAKRTGVTINLDSPNELAPNTAKPYIVVVASVNGTTSTTYFRKWMLGVVVHGFLPGSIVPNNTYAFLCSTGVPAWEGNMAKELHDIDGYDLYLPYDWSKTCALYKSDQAVAAGFDLGAQIVKIAVTNDHIGDVLDIHLIGHSRGAVVVTQALKYLAQATNNNFAGGYIELTLLDPHPANNDYGAWDSSNVADPIVGGIAQKMHFLTSEFQKRAADPRLNIVKGVKTLDVWYQKSKATGFSQGLRSIEETMNLWGMFEAIDANGIPLTEKFLPLMSYPGGMGHSEVPLIYEEEVVKSGHLNRKM